MATRERPADRGRRRLTAALRRLADEHRQARVSAGLSLRETAAASGTSRTRIWRFERGQTELVSIPELGAWFAVLGLDLVLKPYPAGDPIRDRAQIALLERFRARLHPSLRWRTEVPLPVEGDLRAWDGEVRGRKPRPWRARVEAETNAADGQALERKLTLKLRDDPDGHVILLLADTRANRIAVRALRTGLRDLLPLDTRPILAAIGAGRDPGANGIVIL